MEATFTELTPIQESAFLTLYLRYLDAKSRDPILGDAVSRDIGDRIDYDFGRQKVQNSLVLDLATRTKTLDRLIRDFAAKHPDAVVIDLGCGLDPRAARCGLPDSVDWYDVDYPEVMDIRERYLPGISHPVRADLRTPGWLDGIPSDRPAMVVADGLMAFVSGEQYKAMTRYVTSHFPSGEFAFNAYTRWVLKVSRYSGTWKALGTRSPGEGIDDPREAEDWGAGLHLAEELLLARAPEIEQYPEPLRTFTRICARSVKLCRVGNRVLRYRF